MTINQNDHYGCGPTAIYNAMVLLNKQPPNIKKLYKLSGVTEDGLLERDLRKCLKKLGLTLSNRLSKITKKDAIYLCTDGPYRDEYGLCYHYTIVKNYKVYNFYDEKLQKCYKVSKRFNELRKPLFKEIYESKKIN